QKKSCCYNLYKYKVVLIVFMTIGNLIDLLGIQSTDDFFDQLHRILEILFVNDGRMRMEVASGHGDGECRDSLTRNVLTSCIRTAIGNYGIFERNIQLFSDRYDEITQFFVGDHAGVINDNLWAFA